LSVERWKNERPAVTLSAAGYEEAAAENELTYLLIDVI